MRSQFIRGQQLLTAIIGFHLLFGLITIALWQSVLLPYFLKVAYSIPGADVSAIERLQVWAQSSVYQRHVMSQQVMSFAFHIFWCIMLYLGFNWVRILWGISWLLSGVGGLIAFALFFVLNLSPGFMISLVVINLIYGTFGVLLLFSPTIRVYGQTMRR